MSYDPEDYGVDWRRMCAGYGLAIVAMPSLFTFELTCCLICPPLQV
jgi:hypothetical protein